MTGGSSSSHMGTSSCCPIAITPAATGHHVLVVRMAQWSTAASLAGWIGPPVLQLAEAAASPPPWQAPVPGVPPRRPARRKGRIGCASVPRELGAAAEAEKATMPVIVADSEVEGVACDACGGAGWMLCDFCKGKKNNVKSSESSQVHRRCPTCKAAAGFRPVPDMQGVQVHHLPETGSDGAAI